MCMIAKNIFRNKFLLLDIITELRQNDLKKLLNASIKINVVISIKLIIVYYLPEYSVFSQIKISL